jgi:hypothetical protein
MLLYKKRLLLICNNSRHKASQNWRVKGDFMAGIKKLAATLADKRVPKESTELCLTRKVF